jgi:hypothetical protein
MANTEMIINQFRNKLVQWKLSMDPSIYLGHHMWQIWPLWWGPFHVRTVTQSKWYPLERIHCTLGTLITNNLVVIILVKIDNCVSAVIISPSSFDIKQYLRTSGLGHANVNNDKLYIFTLVAGIRPVKDPIFLLDTFSSKFFFFCVRSIYWAFCVLLRFLFRAI